MKVQVVGQSEVLGERRMFNIVYLPADDDDLATICWGTK